MSFDYLTVLDNKGVRQALEEKKGEDGWNGDTTYLALNKKAFYRDDATLYDGWFLHTEGFPEEDSRFKVNNLRVVLARYKNLDETLRYDVYYVVFDNDKNYPAPLARKVMGKYELLTVNETEVSFNNSNELVYKAFEGFLGLYGFKKVDKAS